MKQYSDEQQMSVKSVSGKWKGTFKYGEGYGLRTNKSVDFTLELTEDDGEFTGFSRDVETEKVIKEPATVVGFWEEELISFTKYYACYFDMNEEGEIIVNRSKKHPEIIFSGEFNETEGRYTGDWEIPADSLQDSYESDLTMGRGTWEMSRVKE